MTHTDYYGKCAEKRIICQMCKRINDNMFSSCKDDTKSKSDLTVNNQSK